jgi:hypothetical protein
MDRTTPVVVPETEADEVGMGAPTRRRRLIAAGVL